MKSVQQFHQMNHTEGQTQHFVPGTRNKGLKQWIRANSNRPDYRNFTTALTVIVGESNYGSLLFRTIHSL
jgi:hypothetical protein